MNTLLKFGQDRFNDTVEIIVDVRIHETNNLIATGFQMMGPLPVQADIMIS